MTRIPLSLTAALAWMTFLLRMPAPASPLQAKAAASGWTVIGWNDLGMHCMDSDYSVFSILPPFNTFHAHVIDPSGKLVTSSASVAVTYEAVADPSGSINTTSQGKTTFWQFVRALYGAAPAPDTGLAGFSMPGASNTPQAMVFDPAYNWFSATGVPVTPYDDAGNRNTYPMMRLTARDSSGNPLATTDIVAPVSDEMDCRACHASGSGPAAQPSAGWVYDDNPDRDYRLNILRIHDDLSGGGGNYTQALAKAGYNSAGLYVTVTRDGNPVLCAGCHASNALAGTGMDGIPPLTRAVHGFHAGVTDPQTGLTLDSTDNRSACYRCHPGSTTQCLRGVMGSAKTSDGSMEMQCQSCHGNMSAVGFSARQGWLEEPSCQNCHTGTATSNRGSIRYTNAFDDSGAARAPADQTFATNPDTPAAGLSLYRFSEGHGNLQCEACHGSTHAEFPSAGANDNLQSISLQGYAGPLAECTVCHTTTPSTVSGGPHGLHPIGQAWVSLHQRAARGGTSGCQPCHGIDYRGTVLSAVRTERTISAGDFGTKKFAAGTQIGCYSCHNGPRGG